MTKRIRIVEDSEEKLIGVDTLLSRELRKREIFQVDLSLRQGKLIVLAEYPTEFSESVYINGIYLTEGVDYDYTVDQNNITFNNLVVPNNGHVTVTYKYLNQGV